MKDLDAVIQLMRDQPVEIPDAAHREEVRTALLAHQQLQSAPRGRRIYLLALPVAAAAAAALWFVQPTPPRTPMVLPNLPSLVRGHVHPHAGAAFDLASTVPDEIVKLHDGTIDLEVDPLQPHERFRVVVGASEIEVRGTAFSVTADHDQLLEVHVTHGRVEVRPIGDTAVTLVGGGAWRVPQITTAPVPMVPLAPPRKKPAPPKATADQLAYNDGWSALRQSRFDEAVVAFTRTIASDPDGVLADDARFWQAVALGRASRSGDAIVAFRALVDEHPGSSHSAEASVMLGWLLVDAKQLREARERFTAGVDDATASVRESARAGIAAIDRALR